MEDFTALRFSESSTIFAEGRRTHLGPLLCQIAQQLYHYARIDTVHRVYRELDHHTQALQFHKGQSTVVGFWRFHISKVICCVPVGNATQTHCLRRVSIWSAHMAALMGWAFYWIYATL